MIRAAVTITALILLAMPRHAPAQEAASGSALLAAFEEAFVEAIERAEDSVVSIMRINVPESPNRALAGREPLIIGADGLPHISYGLDPSHPDFVPNEMGAGVIVDSSGLVLTNYHVARSNTTDAGEKNLLYVTLPGRLGFYASIWAADPTSDLAVLRLQAGNGESLPEMKPIPMGDAGSLRKGQFVLALGNPYNIAYDGSPSVSWGIVGNLARRHWPLSIPSETGGERRDLHKYGTLIQTDARLNLGTSGGALINLRGEMIGLTTSLAAIAGYEQSAGYAIPMNDPMKRIVQTLVEGREVEYGFLGITLNDPGRLGRSRLGKPVRGVRVEGVYPGTPAERAGIQPHDLIISMGGKPVKERDDLMLTAATQVLGKPIPLVVLRNKQRLNLSVELTKFPVEPGVIASVRREPWRGITIDYPTADVSLLRESLHDRSYGPALQQGCVLVTSVLPGSPADNAGVAAKSLISHVNGNRVRSPDEFEQAAKGLEGTVELQFFRLSQSDDAVVRVPPK